MPKRHHAAPDTPDESDDQSDQSTPTTKRARRSDAQEEPTNTRSRRAALRKGKGRAATPSDDEDEDVDIQGCQSQETNASAEEEEEEVDEAKWEAEWEDKIRDLVSKNGRTGKVGAIAEHGIIESIEMHQFMCHIYLHFPFDPQVNFLIGHNGSGKSAVLSAITVALGGKVSSTGRGSGLKAFIREGQSVAEVTICIKNGGPEAYKPTEYGDRISITRRFTIEGGSTWKIKSKSGKVISNKKEELAAICDHMNIQVDNPMTVLTQDSARQFLSASGPGDKYSLFMRGTLLSHLEEEYMYTVENIRAADKILHAKKEALPDLKAKVKTAKTRFDEAESARGQKKQVEKLKNELAWAYVQRKEDALSAKTKELARLESRIPRIDEELEKIEEPLAAAQADVIKAERDLKNLQTPEELNNRRKDLNQQLAANGTMLRDLRRDMNDVNQNVVRCTAQIKSFEEQINIETRKLEALSQKDHNGLQARVAELRTTIEGLEARRNEVLVDVKRTSVTAENLKADGMKEQARVKDLEEQVKQAQTNIDAARRHEKDALVPYGHDIKGVLAQVQKMRWHGDVPVGPLGMYVKAKDPGKWGQLLRNQLGVHLTAFAITDARDRPALQHLLKQTNNPHIRIVISEKDMFDFSAGEPPAHVYTVRRALDVSNEYVLRILVNQANIERVVLAHTRREAEQILNEIRGGQAWSLDGFQVRVFGDGVSSTKLDFRRGDAATQLLLTGKDTAAQIAHYEEEMRIAQEEANRVREQNSSMMHEYHQLRRAIEQKNEEGQNIDAEIRRKKADLNRVQAEANDDLPVNVAALEDAKKAAIEEKDNLLESFQAMAARKTEIDAKSTALQDELKGVQEELQGHANQRRELESHVELLTANAAEMEVQKNHYLKKKAEAAKSIEVAKAESAHLEQELTSWVKDASKFGERVETSGKPEDLERKLKSVEKALKESEKRQGASVEELALELTKAEEQYGKVKNELYQLRKLNSVLNSSIISRVKKWEEFRRHIALRCKIVFQLHLSQRGYYGKIDFDHKAAELNLRVQTDDQIQTQGDASKDPRSLSGGEKSFSTICLLLALWESIGCPLRCLDEFDVFMDAVNRKISISMMMETANSSDHKQYILISPQELDSRIIPKTGVRVLRMNDPERRVVPGSS